MFASVRPTENTSPADERSGNCRSTRSPRSVDRTARQLINSGQNIIPARISSRLTSFETAPPKTISTIAM